MNWRSKKVVLLVIGGACLAVFLFGMAAAWHNRNNTTCKDGKPPLQQRGGILGQTVYRCHDNQIVTVPG